MTNKDNFINDFTQAMLETEVPELYSLWTSLAGVSALLGRRVVLNVGRMRLFPNICVILIAESGQRKSTPIVTLGDEVFMRLPKELRPNLIPQECTPQRLVQVMNNFQTKPQDPLEDPVTPAFGLIEELGTFLGHGTYEGGMPMLLNNLIDCRTHDKQTVGRQAEVVTNPCFGFIGATTIQHIRRVIPEGSIAEGMTSRFIFVHVEGKTKSVPFPPLIPSKVLLALLREAARLAQVNGEVIFSEDVYASHLVEYSRFRMHSPFWSNPHLIGYCNRRDKHLMRLAMIFAVASGSMTVFLGHYEAALSLLYKSENIMQRMIQKITSSTEGSKTSQVLELISREDVVSRTALLRAVVHMMNSRELGEVLSSLRDSGQIVSSANGQDQYYMTKEKSDLRKAK